MAGRAGPASGPLRLGVLASGRGTNLQAIMDAAGRGELPARVAVVVSDRAGARALERARAGGVDAVHLDPRGFPDRDAYEAAVVAELGRRGVEAVALAGYMRLVGRVLLDAYPGRILNVHPALLPSFPGLDAQRRALEHGVKLAGCTVHFVDEGTDSGPIILQAAVPVLDDDGVDSLSERILEQEHRIYVEALRLLAEGRLRLEGRRVVIGRGRPRG